MNKSTVQELIEEIRDWEMEPAKAIATTSLTSIHTTVAGSNSSRIKAFRLP